MINYPKIGIRSTIDGRWGGVCGNLEFKTMGMAVSAAALNAKKQSAFLISGMWLLIDVQIDGPIVTETARIAQFGNESGVNGKINFLQNIT